MDRSTASSGHAVEDKGPHPRNRSSAFSESTVEDVVCGSVSTLTGARLPQDLLWRLQKDVGQCPH